MSLLDIYKAKIIGAGIKLDDILGKNYGVIDLGTLEWQQSGVRFYSQQNVSSPTFPVIKQNDLGVLANIFCGKYVAKTRLEIENYNMAVSVHGDANARYITVTNSSCSTPAEIKTALDGVYLVYELATPRA